MNSQMDAQSLAALQTQPHSPSGVPTPLPAHPSAQTLTAADVDRIVEMAWEDRTPFEAIEAQFGLPEADVIALLRRTLKPASWRRWRKRVQGRSTKHQQRLAHQRHPEGLEAPSRFRCSRQRSIAHNRISKRT